MQCKKNYFSFYPLFGILKNYSEVKVTKKKKANVKAYLLIG